jgi:hypothetical protein
VLLTALAVTCFLLAWALIHHGFYARDEIVDTPVYQGYGDRMAGGELPYRDFRPEYPPLALPAFLFPSLLAGEGAPEREYRDAFEWLMAACGVAVLIGMAAVLHGLRAGPARMGAALAFAAVAPLALGSVVLSRFDLWPAALSVAAVAALVHGRSRLGAFALALAVAAKIYGGVLAPLAAVWIWRRYGGREALGAAVVFAATLLACFGPFLVLAPDGVAASIGRQLSRPLQIESLASALLLAGGAEIEMKSGRGSQNVAGTPGVVVGIAATIVQGAVLLWLWLRFARGPMERERLVRFAAAALLAFVALGKVLSPQFLLWLLPLVPLVGGRRGLGASALLAGALVLTQVWFPFRYWDFALTFDETVSWLVLGRDLVLVAALAVLVWPFRQGPASDPGVRRRFRAAGRHS